MQHRLFATVFTLALGAATIAGADGPRRQLLVVAETLGGETEAFDLGQLADGESRELHTENGKKVMVTRSGESFSVDLDGKRSTVLINLTGDDELPPEIAGANGAAMTKIIVHKEQDDASGYGYAFVTSDELTDEEAEAKVKEILSRSEDEGRRIKIKRVKGAEGDEDVVILRGKDAKVIREGDGEKVVIIERKVKEEQDPE